MIYSSLQRFRGISSLPRCWSRPPRIGLRLTLPVVQSSGFGSPSYSTTPRSSQTRSAPSVTSLHRKHHLFGLAAFAFVKVTRGRGPRRCPRSSGLLGTSGFSSSPGGSLPRGPHQIRTWRFPPSGSSADVARGSRATTVRSCGDMIRRRRSAGHESLRTITPTRAAFARPGPGGYPFPGVIARMQPSDSLIPIGLGSGRPLPSAYPGARATRSNEGLPGVRAVLFQRAVGVRPRWVRVSARPSRQRPPWPSGCMRPWAPRNERYFEAARPTAHSLACLRIGVFVTADAARLATGVGGLSPDGARTRWTTNKVS